MNPHKGEVSFEAGGQTYVYKFGTYAMAVLQRRTGLPIKKYLETRDEWGADECLLMFHSSLFQQHKLTEEQVADIIDEIGFDRAADIILEAMGLSQPSPAEAANGGTARPRRGTTTKVGISTNS